MGALCPMLLYHKSNIQAAEGGCRTQCNFFLSLFSPRLPVILSEAWDLCTYAIHYNRSFASLRMTAWIDVTSLWNTILGTAFPCTRVHARQIPTFVTAHSLDWKHPCKAGEAVPRVADL